jgi:hypothetical protein
MKDKPSTRFAICAGVPSYGLVIYKLHHGGQATADNFRLSAKHRLCNSDQPCFLATPLSRLHAALTALKTAIDIERSPITLALRSILVSLGVPA